VTRLAINLGTNVAAVIEVHVVWNFVNANPLNRLAGFIRITNLLQLWRFSLHRCMTVHARLRCWNWRMSRFLNACVTVLAAYLKLTRMKLMREWDWLFRTISNVGKAVPETKVAHKEENRDDAA
jgi:hypothetical protein